MNTRCLLSLIHILQLICGEMHYARIPHEYWRDRLKRARAMEWTEKYCKSNEGTDFNPEHLVYSREEPSFTVWTTRVSNPV